MSKGYEYFEHAVNMPEDCASFKLRLRIEYSRLLDWADVAGLSNEKDHAAFDIKFKANRHIILAVLGEMNALFQSLQKEYNELRLDGEDQTRAIEDPESDTTGGATNVTVNPGSETDVNIKITPPNPQNGMSHGEAMPKNGTNAIDVGQLSIFQSSRLPKKQQKRTRSLNYIVELKQKVKDVAKEPKRLKWAIFDREKYYEKLGKLTQLTDYLHQLMGDKQLELLAQSTRETCLAMLQLTESVQEMKDLLAGAKIVRMADATDDSDSASVFSQATTLVDPADSRTHPRHDQGTLLERLIQFNIEYVEVNATISSVGSRLDKQEGFKIEMDHTQDKLSRTLATFHNRRVWVEWKDFQKVPLFSGNEKPTWGPSKVLDQRLGQLSALLEKRNKPDEFSIPTCLGYFEDNQDRFGFIFEIPETQHPGGSPVSLFELFSMQAICTINDRIKVAQQVAISVFCLHTISWLHKGLRSASILFLHSEEHPWDTTVKPFISGFEYARPDSTDVTSTRPPNDLLWAAYCHPTYQGNDPGPYRKQFDVYSLGIILLEIAYWKTADDILGITRFAEQTKAKELSKQEVDRKIQLRFRDTRRRILDEPHLLQPVRSNMGIRYYNAVRACIEGFDTADFGQAERSASVDDVVMQQSFLRQVIDMLQGITV
jgi:hypothetical protein